MKAYRVKFHTDNKPSKPLGSVIVVARSLVAAASTFKENAPSRHVAHAIEPVSSCGEEIYVEHMEFTK